MQRKHARNRGTSSRQCKTVVFSSGNPDDRPDFGGHKETLIPTLMGYRMATFDQFPALVCKNCSRRFHSLQPSTPIHLKVKGCGPWVVPDEISCVLLVSMCMD